MYNENLSNIFILLLFNNHPQIKKNLNPSANDKCYKAKAITKLFKLNIKGLRNLIYILDIEKQI